MDNNNYMSGWSNKNVMTANRIDMIADKISFVSEMLEANILALDGVEKEIEAFSRGNVPPSPQMLLALSGRIDSIQSQMNHGLRKMKDLAKEVDLATDTLQSQRSTGW